jgi:hypothetical protein
MELILLLAVAWWLVSFEPLQLFIDHIFRQFPITNLSNYIHSSLGCWKCSSFWTILIYSGSFQLACLGALTAFIINLCLTRLNLK